MLPSFISNEIRAQIKKHMEACWPNEGCGVVTATEFHPIENMAENPKEHFSFDDKSQVVIAQGIQNGTIKAIIHSHPVELGFQQTYDPNAGPSKLDMQQQVETNVPWGLAIVAGRTGVESAHGDMVDLFFWGDQLPRAPLKGRRFIHGIYDCYALARDYYMTEKNILLPVGPRDEQWWIRGDTDLLSRKAFEDCGFRMIEISELKPGDGVLASILSKRLNHCGIYLGDGLVLHHMFNRQSRVEPINVYMRHIQTGLRYVGV